MVWVTKASLYYEPCTDKPTIPAVNRAVMKQVLQRSGLMERVKLPEDARRRTTALHAGAVDSHFFFNFQEKNKPDKSVKRKKKKKGSRLLPDNSTDVSVVRI